MSDITRKKYALVQWPGMQIPTVEEEMYQVYQSGIISVYDFMLTKTYADILVFLVDLSTKKKCTG